MIGGKGRQRHNDDGYASLALVAVIGTIILLALVVSFRGSMDAHDSQVDTQTRVDLAHIEESFLRSLLAIAPNKAIDAMRQEDTTLWSELTWQSIFKDSLAMSKGGHLDNSQIAFQLLGSDVISANPTDVLFTFDEDRFSPLIDGPRQVSSGTLESQSLFGSSQFGTGIPAPLEAPVELMVTDGDYPVISLNKKYSVLGSEEAALSVQDYPLYNLVPYPDLHFGLARPGELFVAKRNWWAFSVDYGRDSTHSLVKNYIFSIYEVPGQAPISTSSYTMLGQHSDGSAWLNTSISGSVSTGSAVTDSNFTVDDGGLAIRSFATIASGTRLSQYGFDSNFDALGFRERARVQMKQDVSLLTVAGNSGRVAFIPINPGIEFYELPDRELGETISDTHWEYYSRGASQCRMQLRIVEVVSITDQTPLSIEFSFLTEGGSTKTVALTRGVDWPLDSEEGGEDVPFQTEHLETGRKAIIVYPERLMDFLQTHGGADLSINHSLVVNPDPERSENIRYPEFPTVGTDLCVVLKECADFSEFTEGFAMVTNLRTYMADDFNQVPIPVPANAMMDDVVDHYPPVAIFTPEKRYGTTLKIRPVSYNGQLGSLTQGDAFAAHPLDFRAGTHESITADLIDANLTKVVSPEQLPPVHLMNWIVTIEELKSSES